MTAHATTGWPLPSKHSQKVSLLRMWWLLHLDVNKPDALYLMTVMERKVLIFKIYTEFFTDVIIVKYLGKKYNNENFLYWYANFINFCMQKPNYLLPWDNLFYTVAANTCWCLRKSFYLILLTWGKYRTKISFSRYIVCN